jgi:ArsR family transcriptional regulator
VNNVLEQEVNQLHAQICAGLADPIRILILYELAGSRRNVTELADRLHLAQPTVSRHLKMLRDRGIVVATRLGPTVEYRLSDDRLIQALDLLRAVLRDNLARRAVLASAFEETFPRNVSTGKH